MRTRVTSLLTLLELAACIAPSAPGRGEYTISGTALGSALVSGQDACVFGARLSVDTPFQGRWEGLTTLGFSRLLQHNGQPVERDTIYHAHWARLTQLGPDSITLALSGPITVTLAAARDDPYSYTGDWVCDKRFPFADDSSKPNPGRWGLLTY